LATGQSRHQQLTQKAAANCANEHESKNYKYDSRDSRLISFLSATICGSLRYFIG